MLKYRRIAAFLISFFFFCPNDAFAHRAGEYVPLNASVTADSLTGAESIDLENYQFEGSNVTDTNIHDSGTDFIGYGETRYPVAVVSAGEITDVPNDLAQDIFQFEQQLLVEGSEIYRLFQKYQSENLTPEQQTRFNSAWQDVVNGYSETIARLDEGINPGETARQRLSGKTIQDVLQHIPELSVHSVESRQKDAFYPAFPADPPVSEFCLIRLVTEFLNPVDLFDLAEPLGRNGLKAIIQSSKAACNGPDRICIMAEIDCPQESAFKRICRNQRPDDRLQRVDNISAAFDIFFRSLSKPP